MTIVVYKIMFQSDKYLSQFGSFEGIVQSIKLKVWKIKPWLQFTTGLLSRVCKY